MDAEALKPWEKEAHNFIRAFSGAYLFGIPLLMTMEMWWLGEFTDPGRLLVFLGTGFLANLAIAHVAGFKKKTTFVSHLDQAIDALAVGIIGAAIVLFVLNRISLSDPLESIVGMVVVQALPLSLGASLANAVFGGRKGREGEQGQQGQVNPWKALLRDVGATAIGAMFIASTIAPTDEIPMLAAGMNYPHMLALVALSLLIGYGIVFASGFDPQKPGTRTGAPFQHPTTETALAYLVALVVAGGVLYLVGRIGPEDPIPYVLEQTLVLGLPATVGGAAGRIVV